eukprot:CAMPEP_0206008954 /NCGR_PEP_ID=MMETSP1464-20131121/8628_1 /ASSEMBLY_ACC=CAM_ASM_001124 /TAXON_ID=119497 /ORGANISM="Exanthemachrysis gayraliae, Strain RCC1523" /LENGTH=48 /DNA_ID= /DNA_START= /DNA_END= /DNA_ORIENTATION=
MATSRPYAAARAPGSRGTSAKGKRPGRRRPAAAAHPAHELLHRLLKVA